MDPKTLFHFFFSVFISILLQFLFIYFMVDRSFFAFYLLSTLHYKKFKKKKKKVFI